MSGHAKGLSTYVKSHTLGYNMYNRRLNENSFRRQNLEKGMTRKVSRGRLGEKKGQTVYTLTFLHSHYRLSIKRKWCTVRETQKRNSGVLGFTIHDNSGDEVCPLPLKSPTSEWTPVEY